MSSFGFGEDPYDPAAHGFDLSHLFRPSMIGKGQAVRVMYRRDDHVTRDAPSEYRNHDPDSRRVIEFLEGLGTARLTAEYLGTCDEEWHDFLAWLHERESGYGALLVGDHPSVGRYVIHVGSPGMGYPGDSMLLWISPEGLRAAAKYADVVLREWGPDRSSTG